MTDYVDLRIAELQYHYPPDDPGSPDFGLDFSSRGPLYPVLKKTLFYDTNLMPSYIEHCNEKGEVVVREDYTWEISEDKTEVISRTRSIVWITRENKDHPLKKVVKKVYAQTADRRKHLIRRRKRVIEEIERQVFLFLSQAIPDQAAAGSASLKTALMPLINLYVENNSNYLREKVNTETDSNYAFLDFEIAPALTLRQHIYNLLTW